MKLRKTVVMIITVMLLAAFTVIPVFAAVEASSEPDVQAAAAEEVSEDSVKTVKAVSAAAVIIAVAAAGAIGMAIVIGKAVDGIARQPEADGKIRTSLMLGLVFIETAIIYALIVTILIIFVL